MQPYDVTKPVIDADINSIIESDAFANQDPDAFRNSVSHIVLYSFAGIVCQRY